jgi:hypothetical protein
MSSKRTGLMPSKKKFTAVGGVGARPIALQNKISSQSPRVAGTMAMAMAPPLPPPQDSVPVRIFDIVSFLNVFSGDNYSGYPDKNLEPIYWYALIEAAVRWNNLLSFKPGNLLNSIKSRYKRRFGKEWKGFELLGINYSYTNGYAGAAVVKMNAKYPFGFLLGINRNGMLEHSRTNIAHTFAHELGHAIGLCATITPSDIVRIPSNPKNVDWYLTHQTYYDRVGGNLPDNTAGRAILGGQLLSSSSIKTFPKTHFEHQKLIQLANARFAAGPSYIMLSDDDGHWNDKMVSLDVYVWDPSPQRYKKMGTRHYGNFYNELMQPYFSVRYDNINGYFISNKSLKYLTEIEIDGENLYVEKTPGGSEVENCIRIGVSPDFTYILNGAVGRIFSAPKGVIKVEQALPSRNANMTVDATTNDAMTNEPVVYNVAYPEGDVGDHNDEEILQIVRNHERIVNDPTYVATRIQCGH